MGYFSRDKGAEAPKIKCAEFLTFKCGEQRYGIPLAMVAEITALTELSALPDATGEIAGAAEHKGAAYTVVDMSMRLLRKPAAISEKSCLIILRDGGGAAGACLVDEPGEIVEIPERDMEKEVSRGFYLCRREGRNILLPDKKFFFKIGRAHV